MSAIDVLSVTPTYGWPIPNPDDPDDVPTDLSELAVGIENTVKGGALLPKPAVNGQWIKGVGGLPVWSAITLADLPPLPGTELGYNQITAPVTVPATSEAAPQMIVNGTTITFDGTSAVLIEFYAQQISMGNSGTVLLNIWRDNVNQGMVGQFQNPVATTGMIVSCYIARRLVPPAGPHTYDVRGWATVAGSVGAGPGGGAGTIAPAFLRVTRC